MATSYPTKHREPSSNGPHPIGGPITPSWVVASLPHQGHGSRSSLIEAYMLAIPFGLLGAHHFYLRRYGFGVLYLCTLGLLGFGWILDLVRLPWLVKNANKLTSEKPKHDLTDAYILWLPFGLFGFHHMYLKRWGWGFLYAVTFGLFGVGWIIDGFRMKLIVDDENEKHINTQTRTSLERKLHDVYTLTLSPLGLFGFQHYYLRRSGFGVLYTLTIGLLGIGWIVDCVRMPCLVKHINTNITERTNFRKKRLDDAYILLIPFGFLGLHHFYLHRTGWGILYFFTFGCLGIGWLIDFIRLPFLVLEYNRHIDDSLLNVNNIPQEPPQIQPEGDSFLVVNVSTNNYPTYPTQFHGQQPPNISYPRQQQPTFYPHAQDGQGVAGFYPPQYPPTYESIEHQPQAIGFIRPPVYSESAATTTLHHDNLQNAAVPSAPSFSDKHS